MKFFRFNVPLEQVSNFGFILIGQVARESEWTCFNPIVRRVRVDVKSSFRRVSRAQVNFQCLARERFSFFLVS